MFRHAFDTVSDHGPLEKDRAFLAESWCRIWVSGAQADSRLRGVECPKWALIPFVLADVSG